MKKKKSAVRVQCVWWVWLMMISFPNPTLFKIKLPSKEGEKKVETRNGTGAKTKTP